jgi:hypothetical protein
MIHADVPTKPLKSLVLEDGTMVDIAKWPLDYRMLGDLIYMTIGIKPWDFKILLKDEPPEGEDE